MSTQFLKRSYVMVLIFMLALFAGSSAQAASACKGLSQSKCSTNCIWVGSYKTKAGNKVSGYCRAKSGKAAASGLTSEAKSKVNKADKKVTGAKKSASEKAKSAKKSVKSKTTAAKKSAKANKKIKKEKVKKITDKVKSKATK
ncbi:MAG TPA: chromosome partitioning protein ParB [Gammaproteobacteria bacterium]|nr:chromosome partitioning protein ParB [Gammaproteobacteria bacterium]